jgi:Ca-activated chloride channel family protein
VLQPALQVAYDYKDEDRPLNVVILSDGMTEQRERTVLLQMLGRRPAGTRVFCIGVGNDVNRPLLSQVAEEAGGLAAFVSRGDNFERQAKAFRRKLLRPAASNVEIAIEGVGVFDVEPEPLPDLFHGSPLRLYGRYRDAGTAQVHIRADIGGEMLDTTVELDFPSEDPGNPEIERMWAWHRVQRLLKDADRDDSRASVVDEIVRLGEGYSIVTEYTSFLVLENDAEYRRWKIERRNALRIERDRKQQERVRERLADLRKQASDLGPVTGSEEPDRAAPARKNATSPQTVSSSPSSRGWDLDFGGGAFDPFTVGIVAALSGLSAAALRRRRRDDR